MTRPAAASGLLSAILFSCTVCAGSVGLQAQDAARGAALVAEARQAVGGEERLRAVKTLDVRGEFRRIAGQTTIEGELQIRLELPDKLRRDEDLSLPGGGPAIIRTEVVNGGIVWEENSGRGGFFMGRLGGGRGFGGAPDAGRGAAVDPAQLEEAQRRAWQGELARYLLVWLLVADGPVAWVGTAEAPDGRADVLEVTPRAGPVMRLFLDQTTHLPLMVTWQGGQPATLQMTLAEYKTVNGLRLPHRLTRGTSDTTTEEWMVDGYRINPAFRADVFTK